MSKFFVKANQIYNNKIEILDEDVNHIKNVLRLEIGENIIICNQDDSTNYDCKITEITSKKVECEIIKSNFQLEKQSLAPVIEFILQPTWFFENNSLKRDSNTWTSTLKLNMSSFLS